MHNFKIKLGEKYYNLSKIILNITITSIFVKINSLFLLLKVNK